jgi:hypothetical protein
VLLDVENLEVDRISLEVDGLRAHVSVLAELANLAHLSVGADGPGFLLPLDSSKRTCRAPSPNTARKRSSTCFVM